MHSEGKGSEATMLLSSLSSLTMEEQPSLLPLPLLFSLLLQLVEVEGPELALLPLGLAHLTSCCLIQFALLTGLKGVSC
jgi:hypothetical protein